MKVLVLNADMQPLNVTTLKRGFSLVYKGKAEVIEYIKDNPIVTSLGEFKRPSIIKLVNYVYLPFKKVPLTRTNIYRRDGHACLYCGSRSHLTLDHVLPKSRGGGNTWENLATCCKKCNSRKDNMTPKEAGMKMSQQPYRPTFIQFALGNKGGVDSWEDYFN